MPWTNRGIHVYSSQNLKLCEMKTCIPLILNHYDSPKERNASPSGSDVKPTTVAAPLTGGHRVQSNYVQRCTDEEATRSSPPSSSRLRWAVTRTSPMCAGPIIRLQSAAVLVCSRSAPGSLLHNFVHPTASSPARL